MNGSRPLSIEAQRRFTSDSACGNPSSDIPSVCAALSNQEALINELSQQLGKLREQLVPILVDVPITADAPPSMRPPTSPVAEAILNNTARLHDIIEGVIRLQRAVNL